MLEADRRYTLDIFRPQLDEDDDDDDDDDVGWLVGWLVD